MPKDASKTKIDDAQLVAGTLGGDAAAFDALVARHRDVVLRTARWSLGNWDRADDVAQQAFLDAFKSLGTLHDPTKFRAWLITITKRRICRAQSRAVSEPSTLEFCEHVLYPIGRPVQPVNNDGLAERVRASLGELSDRNRQVVVLHYLDGYTCAEIARKLTIPTGTVKRILHESRNNLRASIQVQTTGGRPRVSTANKPLKGPRQMDWWINGSWPGAMMQSPLAQSICLVINKSALTLKEIGKRIDANEEYVRYAIEPLVNEELVTRTGNGRYIANFVALDADGWIELTRETKQQAVVLADALITHLPALQQAWNRTSLPERGFGWDVGIWPTLAIFVCNIATARNASRFATPAPVHAASGKSYWAGGREVVGPEHVLWCLGFSNYSSETAALKHGYFWSFGLSRSTFGHSQERSNVMGAVHDGLSDPERIAERFSMEVNRVREELARLLEWGVASKHGDEIALTFPVFDQAESDVLVPVADEIATNLHERVLRAATASVADELGRLGYGHLQDQFYNWRYWLEGDISGEALRELVRRGILPEPGDPAPMNFCLVGWRGDLPLMRWSK